MDKIYRVPLHFQNGVTANLVIGPNPWGDPHTVKLTLPYPEDAWAILPRELFADEINRRTRP